MERIQGYSQYITINRQGLVTAISINKGQLNDVYI